MGDVVDLTVMRRGAIALLAAVLLLVLAVAVWQASLARTAPPMLIIAHRGDIDHWPENTLPAIVGARDAGADGVEFDVHRSGDGTWWVIHDSLDRTTTGSGWVADSADAEILELTIDGGLGFRGHPGLGVPRLTEVLDALQGWQGVVIVDVKTPGTEAALDVARMVGDAWMLVHEPEVIASVERQFPQVVTILGFEHASATDLGEADGWSVGADLPILGLYTNLLRRNSMSVVFVGGDHRDPETEMLYDADRYNVTAFITNQLSDALRAR